MATPPRGDAAEHLCPRCGTPFIPGQEYCLDCGFRLSGTGLVGSLSKAWRDRFAWYPGDWVWPALLGLVVALVAGVVAGVVAASTGSGHGHPLVATQPGQPREPVSPPATETVAVPSAPTTVSGPPTTPTAPPPATTTPAPPGALVRWPTNRNGFTVVLESIPVSAGRGLAVARARAAARAGLPQVGVIASARYSSLHPGYYVVFSGIYGSKSQADAAKNAAAAKGFGSAYSREITR